MAIRDLDFGFLLTDKIRNQGKATILEITERVRRVQAKHRADVGEEGFNTELKFGLVEVVYEWAKGMVCPLLPLLLLFSRTNSSFL